MNKGKIVAKGTPREIKESLVEEYLEIDAVDRQALEQELKEKNLPYTQQGPFKIDLTNRNVQNLIKNIDTKLTAINIHTPKLEEAYIEIIEEHIDETKK